MEETPLDKFNSFSKNTQIPSPGVRNSFSPAHDDDHCDGDRNEISENVDRFIDQISAIDDKSSNPPQVPDFVESLLKAMELKIVRYNSGEIHAKFRKMTEEDLFFIQSVRRISRLTNALSEFSSDANVHVWMNKTSVALQRAMVFLEEEFRVLLEDSRSDFESESVQSMRKSPSFNSDTQAEDREPDSDDYPSYSAEDVTKMHEIAMTMISAGYETECVQVYYISRRNAIRNQMVKLDLEITLNMDDMVRVPWETLEAEISRWISVVKTCTDVIFPGETRLAESVFADYPSICQSLLANIVKVLVIQLLDFAEATAMAKRSAEKLFKYLDMYEALQNLIPSITGQASSDELIAEVSAAVDRIGESAVSNFWDLENSIKGDGARTPVPGGAVHPLTRYVINYLKYTCEYKDTLEKIFEKHTETEKKYTPVSDSDHDLEKEKEKESESPHSLETINTTPFSIQVVTVMDLLDGNLDRKSRLYRDPSLKYIFLMNNGRYILQKVKGSNEILQVMGDTWCRRRSTVVRQYHKNYQRETWNRVLQSLNQDGLVINGKANKQLLKERFKIFTTIFDEIYRTQSTWVVSDEQLQSELRISISAVVIPAYRSFVGRFRQYLDSGKQADKYIKYQPEDVETMVEQLFEGNNSSMARRK